jgi:hypothetical protein
MYAHLQKRSVELLDLVSFCSIADAEVEGKHLPCLTIFGEQEHSEDDLGEYVEILSMSW